MKKCILLLMVLFLIPTGIASEAFPDTSYWGYVTVDGITKSNAQVAVYDSYGKELASTTSNQDAQYQVTLKRDVLPDGETITFKIDGRTASSRTIGAKGTNNRLDLSAGGTSSTPSGGSVSGGGGGGAVTAEPFENIVKTENREEIVSKDVPKTFSFTTPELPVSQVTITSNINAGLIKVQVELLKTRSTLAKDDAPGTVYKYVSIWVGTSGFAVPDNIKEAVVKFKLPSSWITSNGFTEADIAMQRWNGTQWVKLVTEKKGNEGNYTIYEAKTNAFSPFVISGIKKTTAAVTSGKTVVATGTKESNVTATAKDAPGFGIALAIAGALAVVLRRRHN